MYYIAIFRFLAFRTAQLQGKRTTESSSPTAPIPEEDAQQLDQSITDFGWSQAPKFLKYLGTCFQVSCH